MIEPDEMDAAGRRLYSACKQGDTKQVRELLMSRAPVDFISTTEYGQTPLIVASQNGCQEIVSILLDFGASKDIHSRVCAISWLALSLFLLLRSSRLSLGRVTELAVC